MLVEISQAWPNILLAYATLSNEQITGAYFQALEWAEQVNKGAA